MPIVRLLAVGIGKVLSKVFGLATMSFFGRMPSRDDDRIALVGVASLTWLALVVAAFLPEFAEPFIPFVDDEDVARITSAVTAVVLPVAIGVVVATMHNNRARGARAVLSHCLWGYVYTAVIGLTVTAIVITVPLLKANYILRRFTVGRIMVMIPRGAYDDAVRGIRGILDDAGIETSDERLHPVIAVQFRVLGWILGRVFDRDVADEMRVLRGRQDGDWFEVTIHAADISIIGSRRVVHLLRAVLAEGLGDDIVYLTWDDDSQARERDVRHHRQQLRAGEAVEQQRIDDLVADLRHLQLDQEPWDALRRLIYRLERDNERLKVAQHDARATGGDAHSATS